MFIFLYIYIAIYKYISMYIYLYVYKALFKYILMCIYLYVYLYVYISQCLNISMSKYLYVYKSMCLYFYVFVKISCFVTLKLFYIYLNLLWVFLNDYKKERILKTYCAELMKLIAFLLQFGLGFSCAISFYSISGRFD